MREILQNITAEMSSLIADGRSLNEQIDALRGVAEQLHHATALQNQLLNELSNLQRTAG